MSSIRDFLSQLDIDQLKNAITIANGFIAAKDAEPKVKLWVISSEWVNLAAYPEDQYEKAMQRLVELLGKEEKERPGRDIGFFLKKYAFIESEAQEMLKL
ncbi:hypothetical protein JCM14076_06410 [Methylosoma difficile]